MAGCPALVEEYGGGVAAPGLERACEVRHRELVELVKQIQRWAPGTSTPWWGYCRRHQRYCHDPAKQPAEFLEGFVQEQGSQRYCHNPARQPAELMDRRSSFFCDVCSMDMKTAQKLVQHKLGRKHLARARAACPLDPLPQFWCEVCGVDMQSASALAVRRLRSRRHAESRPEARMAKPPPVVQTGNQRWCRLAAKFALSH